jgi:hypothetical protein
MIVFYDFEYITERLRAEKQRKFRKRIAMATVSAFVLEMFTLSQTASIQRTAKKSPLCYPVKKLYNYTTNLWSM